MAARRWEWTEHPDGWRTDNDAVAGEHGPFASVWIHRDPFYDDSKWYGWVEVLFGEGKKSLSTGQTHVSILRREEGVSPEELKPWCEEEADKALDGIEALRKELEGPPPCCPICGCRPTMDVLTSNPPKFEAFCNQPEKCLITGRHGSAAAAWRDWRELVEKSKGDVDGTSDDR